MTAMRLISSEMPCRNSSAKPIRISDLGRPLRQAAGIERLLVDRERSAMKNGTAGDDHDDRERQQEERRGR